MQIESTVIFTYKTTKEAKIASGSVKPDNMDFIESYVENNSLVCKFDIESLRTTLATLDDILFCEMMAEKVMDFTKEEIK
jgi:hypothetical protein